MRVNNKVVKNVATIFAAVALVGADWIVKECYNNYLNSPYMSDDEIHEILTEVEEEFDVSLNDEQRDVFLCLGQGLLVKDALAIEKMTKKIEGFSELSKLEASDLDHMSEEEAFDLGKGIGNGIGELFVQFEDEIQKRMDMQMAYCGYDDVNFDSLEAQFEQKMDSFTPNF